MAPQAEDKNKTILVTIAEETVTAYRVPVSKMEQLRLPSDDEQIAAEPYIDDEFMLAAIEGIEPESYSVLERTSAVETGE